MRSYWFFLFLMFATIFAGQLYVNLYLIDETPAVGTNVIIKKDGLEIMSGKADSKGKVSFNLSDGKYFIIIDRSYYPLQVHTAYVSDKTNVSFFVSEKISYPVIFGQIFGSSNCSISLYQNQTLIKKESTDSYGYFLIKFIPEGEYKIVFSSPGFAKEQIEDYLFASQLKEIYITLKPENKTNLAENRTSNSKISILVEPSAKRYSILEVFLVNGSNPIPNQKILIETPSGTLEATTDKNGLIKINLAEDGIYKFKWGNISASTFVFSENNKDQSFDNQSNLVNQTNKSTDNNQPSQSSQNQIPPLNQNQSQSQELDSKISLLLVLISCLVVVFLSLVFIFLKTKKKVDKQDKLKEKISPKHVVHYKKQKVKMRRKV